MARPILMLLTVLVGALLPIQSGVNANLSKSLGHPLFGALANFVIGGLALLLAALALRLPVPAPSAFQGLGFGTWLGGLCGAAFVLTAVLAAPRLGAGLFVACLLAGQLSSSVVVDHMGWAGFSFRPVTGLRILGLALLAAGVACIRRG